MRPIRPVSVLLLAAALAGCEAAVPSGPEPADVLLSQALADAARAASSGSYVPLLERLFANAVTELQRQKNTEAATRLVTRHRTLGQDAGRARAAGDTAAARSAEEARDVEASLAVVRVLGRPILQRLLLSVTTDLGTFDRRVSAARTTRATLDWMAPVLRRAERLKSAAEGAQATDPALSLRLAAQAFDLLAILPR